MATPANAYRNCLRRLTSAWRLLRAAYLLEPDLKEARGGFRDVSMLRALAASWLTDRPRRSRPYERLLDVRDALHLALGRTLDQLISMRPRQWPDASATPYLMIFTATSACPPPHRACR